MENRLYTTREVGEILGRERNSIFVLAKKHNLGQKIGRDLLLSPEDIEKLREIQSRGPGRPDGAKDSYQRTVTHRPPGKKKVK